MLAPSAWSSDWAGRGRMTAAGACSARWACAKTRRVGSTRPASIRGKVCSGVAAAAQQAGVPCLVLAGQVRADVDAARSAGIGSAYAVADELGSIRAALERPAEGLARLAERVARTCATME